VQFDDLTKAIAGMQQPLGGTPLLEKLNKQVAVMAETLQGPRRRPELGGSPVAIYGNASI
jgi:hypothetical protein